MRIIVALLVVLLIALQIQVWQERSRLKALDERLSVQVETNEALKARNDALFAEVQDLRLGLDAIEERARAELGLVGENESFYLIVDPELAGEFNAIGQESMGQESREPMPAPMDDALSAEANSSDEAPSDNNPSEPSDATEPTP